MTNRFWLTAFAINLTFIAGSMMIVYTLFNIAAVFAFIAVGMAAMLTHIGNLIAWKKENEREI